MSTVFLVAGSSTTDLRKFLEKKGTLEITDSYETLHNYLNEINNSITYVDKLVLVSRKNDSDFTQNVKAINSLLIGAALFQPKEILFFVDRDSDSAEFCTKLMSYIESHASNDPRIRVPSYTIYKFDGSPSFDYIYSSIMGTNKAVDVDVVFDTIYLAERGKESKQSFEEEDNSGNLIEPFNYKEISQYEEMKRVIRSQDSGELLYDEPVSERKELEEIIPRLKINRFSDIKSVVVSGQKGSGVTTLVAALLASLVSLESKSIVIECNRKQNLSNILTKGNVLYNMIDATKLLEGSIPELKSGINIVRIKSTDSVLFLRNISKKLDKRNADFLIVDSSADNFSDVVDTLRSSSPHIVLESWTDEFSIQELKPLVMLVESAVLVLNDYQRETSLRLEDVEPKKLKSTLKNLSKIYHPMFFNHLDLDEQLAVKLLGLE